MQVGSATVRERKGTEAAVSARPTPSSQTEHAGSDAAHETKSAARGAAHGGDPSTTKQSGDGDDDGDQAGTTDTGERSDDDDIGDDREEEEEEEEVKEEEEDGEPKDAKRRAALGVWERKRVAIGRIDYAAVRNSRREAYEKSVTAAAKKQHFLFGADVFVMERVWDRRHQLVRPDRRGVWLYTVPTLEDFWSGTFAERWLEAPRTWDHKKMQAMLPHHPLPVELRDLLSGLSASLATCVKTSVVHALFDYEPEREIVVHVKFPFHPKHSFTHTRALDDPSSCWSKHASGVFMSGFASDLRRLWAPQAQLHRLELQERSRETELARVAAADAQAKLASARARKRTSKKKKKKRATERQRPDAPPQPPPPPLPQLSSEPAPASVATPPFPSSPQTGAHLAAV